MKASHSSYLQTSAGGVGGDAGVEQDVKVADALTQRMPETAYAGRRADREAGELPQRMSACSVTTMRSPRSPVAGCTTWTKPSPCSRRTSPAESAQQMAVAVELE